jgi:hypothetical protein
MYFLANEYETPVQPIDEEEFTKLQKRRNSFHCTEKRKSQKTPAHAQQSSAFPERQFLFTVWPPKKAGSKPVRSQARPRGSEAHRLRKKPSSWTIVKNTTTQEDDSATRQPYSWRRKTRYKLDEEAPLTTPVDVSVLRYYRWRGSTLDHTRRRVCSQVLSFRSREFWLCSVGENHRE